MPDETTPGIPVTFPVLVIEGLATADGRYIEPGALGHRALPIPILAQTATAEGHSGAQVIGRLDELVRIPGPEVVSKETGQPFPEGTFVWTGSGTVDGDAPATVMAQKGYLTGNSVDLSEIEAELVMLDAEEVADGDTVRLGKSNEQMRLTAGKIAATTLVPIPAFADAFIELDGTVMTPAADMPADALVAAAWRSSELGDDTCVPCALGEEPPAPELVTASAVPDDTFPPIEWFRDPGLPGPTPLRVDDDGRVYGHLATWGVCHTGFSGQCLMAPHSPTDYSYFRTGARRVLGDDAQLTEVGIGHITLGAGHASDKMNAQAAAAHYDNTASVVADVEVGEDSHGIWVAGALRAGVATDKVEELRAAPLSGDWRRINGAFELVAALAVNVPGFPIPRARVASGVPLSLVAAGVVRPEPVLSDEHAALAERIAERVAAQLGVRLPTPTADDRTDGLAARKAAVAQQMAAVELAARRRAALSTLG